MEFDEVIMVEKYSEIEQIKGLIAELDDYINHYHGGSVSFVHMMGKLSKFDWEEPVRIVRCPLPPFMDG
jgi:hypothetical protein